MQLNIDVRMRRLMIYVLLVSLVFGGVIAYFVPTGDLHKKAYRILAAVPVVQIDRDGNRFTLPYPILEKVVQAKKDFTVRDISPGTSVHGHEMSVMKLVSTDGKASLYVPVSSHIRRYERLAIGDRIVGMPDERSVVFKTEDKVKIAVVADPSDVQYKAR